MNFLEHFLCRQLLFDLICYEIRAGRLGREIMHIFDEHLAHCSLCRQQALDFFQMLQVASHKEVVADGVSHVATCLFQESSADSAAALP
jgi:hypothetical protein